MELTLMSYGAILVIAAVIFSVIDLIWIGVIAKDLYRKELKSHLAKDFNSLYAAIFYVTFLVGLMYFAIVPAVNGDSLGIAMGRGLAYGFFTYATYEFTNAATLKNWSDKVVVADLLWGSFLSFIVSTATYSLYTGFTA